MFSVTTVVLYEDAKEHWRTGGGGGGGGLGAVAPPPPPMKFKHGIFKIYIICVSDNTHKIT